MNCESHPGAIWFKDRRPKPLVTYEARERQARRDLRKSMKKYDDEIKWLLRTGDFRKPSMRVN